MEVDNLLLVEEHEPHGLPRGIVHFHDCWREGLYYGRYFQRVVGVVPVICFPVVQDTYN